jgi:hypothetical protein
MVNTVRVNVATPKLSINSASTERQQILVLPLVSSIGCATVFTHNPSIDRHNCQYG